MYMPEILGLIVVLALIIGFYFVSKNKSLSNIEKVLWLLFNFFIPPLGLIGYLLFSSK